LCFAKRRAPAPRLLKGERRTRRTRKRPTRWWAKTASA